MTYNSPTKLLVLMPGEKNDPGNLDDGGKDPAESPDDQLVGSTFTVRVISCDNWYNHNIDTDASVSLHTSDPNLADPLWQKSLTGGERYFDVTYFKAETAALISATSQNMATSTSTAFAVDAGNATQLMVIVPFESYEPGNIAGDGKGSSVDTQHAGVPFTVTVRAVDDYYNTDTTVASLVGVSLSDGNAVALTPLPVSLINGTTYFSIIMVTAGTQTITAEDYETSLSSAVSSVIQLDPGEAVQYQVLVPNEQNVPGIGKSGSIEPQTAGAEFTVTVNACDAIWNVVLSTDVDTVVTTPDDSYDTEPGTKTLTNGSTYFVITPITAADDYTVRASGKFSPIDSEDIDVDPDSPQKLIALVPGEDHEPGNYSGSAHKTTPYGKTSVSAPDNQPAGVKFDVTVNVCDQYWNIVDTEPVVSIALDDPNSIAFADQTLVNGTTVFAVFFKTANTTWTVTVDAPIAGYTAYTSTQIHIDPGQLDRLQVLLPGEEAEAGTGTGKTGALPDDWVAGSTYTVTINAVDEFYNIDTTTSVLVEVDTDDQFDIIADDQEYLVSGTEDFDICIIQAGTRTVSAVCLDSNISGGDSSGLPVEAAAADRLLVLVPGVSEAPGDKANRGRTGQPFKQTAGIAFTVTVRATDRYWNMNRTAEDFVLITDEDSNNTGAPAYTHEPSPQFLSKGEYIFDPTGPNVDGLIMVTKEYVLGNPSVGWEVYASTAGGAALTADYSQPVPVDAGAASRLQTLILPDEQNVPGGIGKSGTVQDKTAGVEFDVRVYLTDDLYNISTDPDDITGLRVEVEAGDPHDTGSPDRDLNALGYRDFPFTLVTASTWTFVAVDRDDTYSYISSTSSPVYVEPTTQGYLQIIMEGETTEAGNADEGECANTQEPYGKTNGPGPDAQEAGTEFTITVNVTDKYWNLVDHDCAATITTSDNYVTDPGALSITGGSSTQTITLISAGTATVSAQEDNLVDVTSEVFAVEAADATKLRVLVPGVKRAPGEASGAPGASAPYGRTGSPANRTAGIPFTVEVDAVDPWWNIDTSASLIVRLGNTDEFGTAPSTKTLTGGTTSFEMTLVSASTYQKVSSSDTIDVLNVDTSRRMYVEVGPPTKLQILVPGVDPVPGDVANNGKDGTPDPQAAGIDFSVTVNLCDDYWNIIQIDDYDRVVQVAAVDDSYVDDYGLEISTVTLSSGTVTVSISLATEQDNTTYLKVTDKSGQSPLYVKDESDFIDVDAGEHVKLRVLIPGMSPDMGDLSEGKTGNPQDQTAGEMFDATLHACDDFWNVTDSTEDVHLEIEAPYHIDIGTDNLSNGQRVVDITCYTAGDWELTLTDAGTEGLQQQISREFTINSSTISRLLIVLEGETHNPGEYIGASGAVAPYGRYGTSDEQEAGVSFGFEVISTDEYWNKRTSSATVYITAVDTQAIIPGDKDLNQGSVDFNIQLRSVISNNYIYADSASLMKATSTVVTLNPSNCSYLIVSNIVDTTAGESSDVIVVAKDVYGNTADGGSNHPDSAYQGIVTFSVDEDSTWLGTTESPTDGLPADYTFTTHTFDYGDISGHPGYVKFTNGVSLKRGGDRTVHVDDKNNGSVFGEQTGITVIPDEVSRFTVLPLSAVKSPAGNPVAITAYATDDYFNVTTEGSVGLDVIISTFAITFTTQTANGDPNTGNYFRVKGALTNKSVVDSSGAVTSINYYSSHYTGDKTRIQVEVDPSTYNISGLSSWITTVGSTADYLEFVDGDTQFTAGKDPDAEDPYIIRRKDKYGNLAETGDTTINLITSSEADGSANSTNPADSPRHIFSEETSGAVGSPLTDSDFNNLQDIIIPSGEYEAKFYYYEELASWDEISFDTHTLTIDADLNGIGDPTEPEGEDEYIVDVNPDDIRRIVFTTPSRILNAGATSQLMTINTVDDYGNAKTADKDETLTLGSPDSTECGFITNVGTFTKRNSIWTPSSPPVVTLATGTYETSFRYTDNKRGTPRIDVEGTGSPGNTWGPGQQVQTVNPADLHHLGFISDPYTSNSPLSAGVTSWAIVVQSQDRFDNRKELTSTEEVIIFLKDKTSGISGDDADFDFSDDNNTWNEISSVYITTNSASSNFYMKVFKAKPAVGNIWELEAKLKSGGFDSALQDVVVRGGEISQIVITTPQRNIIADHNDYLNYGSTGYIITIETQDKFGNISNITDVDQVMFSLWGDSIDADFATHGAFLSWGNHMITISSGSYSSSYYYADLLKGSHMIYVDEVQEGGYPPVDWTLASQSVEVYPSDTAGFEVTHDGFALVGVDQAVVIRAVDGTSHSNFTDGHPDPYNPYGSTNTWIYYTGVADITTDAPAHPPGDEPTLNYYTWDFQDSLDTGNPGMTSIMVRDGIVTDDGGRPSDPPETWDVPPIKVEVTDRSSATITGISDGLIVAGAIIQPYTDPETGDRVAPEFIYQDTKNVLLERLDIWTNYSTSTWNGMRIHLSGSADDDDIDAVRLWKDGDGDAVFTKPAANDLNNEMSSSPDIFLASGAFVSDDVQLDTDQSLGVSQTIGESRSFYFITADCAYEADKDHEIHLYWEKQYFTGAGNWSPVGAQLSDNNFNILTPTTTVKVTPGLVIVDEYQLICSTDTVEQGQDKVGFIRLDMRTDKYTIEWKSLNLTLVGANALDSDIANVKIYKDLGDQKFEPAAELLVSRGDDEFGVWGAHGSGADGVANIELWNPSPFIDEPKSQIINTSTQTYFIAISFDDSANYDPVNNIGIRIESNVDIKAVDENGFNRVLNLGQFPVESGTPQIVPTNDLLLVDWNKPPGNVPQGSDNKVFAILNLRSDFHSVWWEGLTVDKLGTLPDQYIENVKVWWYISGSTNSLGYPEVNISTNIPAGNRDVLVSEGVDVFVSSQCVIDFPEAKFRDLRTVLPCLLFQDPYRAVL